MTAVTQVIPSKEYERYVRFYMGLVVVLMLCMPIIKIMGLEERVDISYSTKKYRMEFDAILEETKVMGEVNLGDYISNEVDGR